MAARRSTKLVWYHRCVSRTSSAAEHRCIMIVSNIFASRNAPAIAKRRRRRLGQTECEEDTDRGEGFGETSPLEDVTPPGREPSEGVVRSIVNGEVPSPGAAIREHIYNAIDGVPRGSNIEHACRFWSRALDGLHCRPWGEFLYNHLAIPTSNFQTAHMREFEEALQAMELMTEEIDKLHRRAFEEEPSGRERTFAQTKELLAKANKANLVMTDIILLRNCGLDSLEEARDSGTLEYLSLP